MNIVLNKEQLNTLQSKNKFYTYFSSFEKVNFKITNGSMILLSNGSTGILKVTVPVDYEGEDTYISVELAKWLNALSKFADAPELSLSITNKLLKLQVPGTPDVINLGISKFSADSVDAAAFSMDFEARKSAILENNNVLVLNDEVVNGLQVASSLLINGISTNSVGLKRKGVIYADNRIILMTNFKTTLDESLFKDVAEDDDCIFVHNQTVSFLNIVFKDNETVYLGQDYDALYWTDDVAEVVLFQPSRELVLPSEDMVNSIIPDRNAEGTTRFSVKNGDMKNCLDFFTGFFEGSNWKTLNFTVDEGSVIVNYNQAMANLTKKIPCSEISSTSKVSFKLVDIDSVKKPMMKAKNDTDVVFYADQDSVGVECLIGDEYRVVYAKEQED